jgi:signal transduction histidine kinase
MAVDNARLYAAALEAQRLAEVAREAATLTARCAEELLSEANLARHEAAVAEHAKTTFLGTISHEFRTPLTAVRGFTDLLTDENSDPLTEAQRHRVGRVQAASEHLLTLIEEILTFARQQACRAEPRLRDVDLLRATLDAATIVEPLAVAKGLRLVLSLPEGPVFFATDAGKFRQIVLNLAANAVKFTDTGEVRLELEVVEDSALLRVSDTGIGIPPEHVDRVFEAFWQVDQTDTRVGGTGLGLAVTRQLAELLGGDVSLQGKPDGGSLFTVRLPMRPTESPDALSSSLAEVGPAEQRVRGRRSTIRRGSRRGKSS